MTENVLTCACGAQFENSQKFNSHKSHCKEHYIHKYGSLTEYEAHKAAKHKAAGKALHDKAEAKKLDSQSLWAAEQHICERCGEIMTTKFGSGRFCSRACANTRELSDETKAKISQSLVKPEELKVKRIRPKAESNTKTRLVKSEDCCLVCGKAFKSKNKNSARTKRKEFLREIREEDK
jgi:hypothetical protein